MEHFIIILMACMGGGEETCEIKHYEVPKNYTSNAPEIIRTVVKVKDKCFVIKSGTGKGSVYIYPIKNEACK